MLRPGDVITCDYCGECLEVEENDLQVAFGTYGDAIYITCPCCGKMAKIVGVVDIF